MSTTSPEHGRSRSRVRRVGRPAALAAALLVSVSVLFASHGAGAASSLSSGWLAQHTLAGSQCWILTSGAQAPYSPNGTASSWSKKSMKENCLVWTAYGIGSNGQGTVISVGDQNMRGRWTNYGNTAAQNSQAFRGSLNTYNDVAANGTTWVAVGNIGRIQRSNDDGVTFSSAASTPGGVPALSFVAQHHGTWIVGGGSSQLLWRSTDGGSSWSNVSPPAVPNGAPTEFQSAVYNPVYGRWFAAGSQGQIWQSSNDGASWTLNVDATDDSWINRIDVGPTGTMIAVTAGFGISARSTDGGATWNWTNIDGPSLPAFRTVKAGPAGEWIAAGLANRVYYSLDDGVTWNKATGLPSLRTWEDLTYAYVAG